MSPSTITVDMQVRMTPLGKMWLAALKLAGRLGLLRVGVFCAKQIRWVYRIGSGSWKPLEPRWQLVVER